jgi:hypothetical protein
MRITSREELAGYQTILKLPSYLVMEHPETFHTVVVYRKRTPNQVDRLRVMGETVAPGLTSDPPISVPAGMLREIVNKVNSRQREEAWDNESMPPPPRMTSGRVTSAPDSLNALSDRINRIANQAATATQIIRSEPFTFNPPIWAIPPDASEGPSRDVEE